MKIVYCAMAWVFALAACQPGEPTVTLAEAKLITADLQRAAPVVAPPRTVTDIIDELESLKDDGSLFADFVKDAVAQPPATTDRNTLAAFYARRAEGARMLGRFDQAMEDAEAAIGYADGPKQLWAPKSTLAALHAERGDIEQAIRITHRTPVNNHVGAHAVRAAWLAETGDLAGAERSLQQARRLGHAMSLWTRDRVRIPINRSALDMAEARVHYLKGDFAAAEDRFRSGIARMDEFMASGRGSVDSAGDRKSPQKSALLVRTYSAPVLSELLVRQGRVVDAEIVARENLFKQARGFGRNSGQTLEGLTAPAQILSARGRLDDTALLTDAALEIFDHIGAKRASSTRAITRLTLAEAYIGNDNWTDAVTTFDAISRDMAGNPDSYGRVLAANPVWAMVLLRQGRARETIERLTPLYDMARAQLGDEHYEPAELLGLLASAWTVDGQADRAQEAFRIAIPVLLRQDSRSESSATTQFSRQLRLRFILQHYLATLMPGATTGGTLVPRAATGGTQADIATAFRIAEHGRSGAVQRALFASAGRTAIADPVLADLARREQDALNRIGTLNGMVINAGFHDAGTRQAMIDRIDSLKAARTQLMAKISGEFPAYEALINPRPPTLADVRRSLAPNEALIALFVGDERTYVWAVPKSGAVVAAGRDELTDAVALLRGALEPNAATLDDIPPFDVATAYRLFDTLVAPVRAGWQDAESLLVVTNAPLSYLPLSLLPTAPVTLALAPAAEPRFSRYRSVPWLVRSHAVTVLPSVASLIALRTVVRRTVARRAVIGFGDPWFSPEQARQARRVPASSRVAPIMVRAALKTR